MGKECRFCSGSIKYFSTAQVFGQSADFDLCELCQSVQISVVPWLAKAHEGGIADTDTGAAGRSIDMARTFTGLMKLEKRKLLSGIDFGGGSGLLTRLLRDRGFLCKSFDPYASQFFASGFIASELEVENEMDFILAVECVEHLENPVELFSKYVKNKKYFIFTTDIISTPPPDPSDKNPWWYYSLDSGQHITFASEAGIKAMQTRLGFNFYQRIGTLHIFSMERLRFPTRYVSKFPRFWLLTSMYFDLRYKQRFALTDGDSVILKNAKKY